MQSHLARVLHIDAQFKAYLGIFAFLQIERSKYLVSTVLKDLIPLRMFQVHKVLLSDSTKHSTPFQDWVTTFLLLLLIKALCFFASLPLSLSKFSPWVTAVRCSYPLCTHWKWMLLETHEEKGNIQQLSANLTGIQKAFLPK